MHSWQETYNEAIRLAERGEHAIARELYQRLADSVSDPELRSLVANDLGALAAAEGEIAGVRQQFTEILKTQPNCTAARRNLELLAEEEQTIDDSEFHTAKPRGSHHRTKVAIVSLLFNWPSTGGGIVHTFELAKFLRQAGYDVRLIHARYTPWNVGRVKGEFPFPIETLVFKESNWTTTCIQRGFCNAVDAFAPDRVIVTDSWNFKPLLAEAVRGYPYFLRLAAQECLCPLNNVRMLFDEQGVVRSCPRHQFATPQVCRSCVSERRHSSGSLHQSERELAGYGTDQYDQSLRQAFAQAEAVLAVNPLIATMVSPYARRVQVVPSGFDPDRFKGPLFAEGEPASERVRPVQILFAGLVEEAMKGFSVLHEACRRLREKREDFELVATGEPAGSVDGFTRFVGWLSQEQLPRTIRAADLLVFPTIAEEALGRSAVEAMGAGRPVIASRIGGLPFTVVDGLTGLLFEPGNVEDLARKIERLLDDPALRKRMGEAGRTRFEEEYTWPKIIERHYRPLLGEPVSAVAYQENAASPF